MAQKVQRLLALGLFLLASLQVSAQTSVFINEIHYDNSGTDTGEAIEVAGPAGTSLNGWSIVLYNGSNGSSYNTLDLSGVTFSNQQGGIGTSTVTLPANGLQNGAPDGLALVDNNNNVVQFLSYEGDFTASNGVANGLTSTNIGVSESSSTPVGFSLQLGGTGSVYEDFAWENAATATFDAVNTNQVFGSDVLISEIRIDQPSSDNDEYFELSGSAGTSLNGLTYLVIGDGAGSGTIEAVVDLTGQSIDANGFFVAAESTFTLGTANLVTSLNFENSDNVTHLLVEGFTGANGDDLDTNDDGTLDVTPWSNVVDQIGLVEEANPPANTEFVYGTALIGPSGTFVPAHVFRDANGDFQIGAFDPNGGDDTPGAAPAAGGGDPTPQPSNAVVFINEIHYDNTGSDSNEGVEIAGTAGTDLTGWSLVAYNGNGGASYNTVNLSGTLTDAGSGFGFLFTSISGLQNGSPDGIALVDNNGAVVQFLSYEGSFVANGGPANGLNSEDIGVAEASSAPVGTSLQLTGTGSVYADFTWATSATSTYNAVNNGQTIVGAVEVVFVNELHYDNAGSDSNEGIELAGTAGTDLTGWSIVAYNGNGGASYNTVNLSGTFTNQTGGYGFIFFAIAGLQNGAPDGFALVDAEGNVVQFLSYEGSFVASGGPANGLTSEDIGVAESSSAAVGSSLQLTGSGSVYADFTWATSATSTYNAVNNGQSFGGTTPDPDPDPDPDPVGAQNISTVRGLAVGTVVTIRGTLTVADEFGGPAYVQDATGGIAVFDSQLHGNGLFSIGDSVEITGAVGAFNEQVQLGSLTNVVDLGVANSPIAPATVTINNLQNFRGQLVKVGGAGFSSTGVFFPSSNYGITDATGSTDVRIDDNVGELQGRGIPTTAVDVVGVVGNFRGNLQILPRFLADVPGTTDGSIGGPVPTISRDSTLDVVTWNVEFFGATQPNFGQADNQLQLQNAVTFLRGIDADIIALQEVSSETLLAQLADSLGMVSVCSDRFSRFDNPSPDFPSQKLCYLYDASIVSFVEARPLFRDLMDELVAGTATLPGYPVESSRFWASGRLPYLLTVDVSLNGATERVSLVNVHAISNSGGQTNLDRREYDVQVLKDSLDTFFANDNLILLGDYNDDLDEPVLNGANTTVSPYAEFVNDSTNYSAVSLPLSLAGLRTFAFADNVIDHTVISNELDDEYVPNSAQVIFPFGIIDNFSSTTSDHYPVLTRFEFVAPNLPVQRLKLTSMCSNNPATERRWRVRNPNSFPVEVTYNVYRTTQSGTLTAAPGDTFFTTNTVGGANTTILSWVNENGAVKRTTKASGGARCAGAVAPRVVAFGFIKLILGFYPNPFFNIFTIFWTNSEEPATVKILDLQGREFYSKRFEAGVNQVEIDTDEIGMKPGIYMISIENSQGKDVARIVKQ